MPVLQFISGNWRWLSAGALLTFSSSFGQTFFISIFAGEIRGAFGLSHGAWGAIYTMGTAASALAMVWAGALTDRWRVRSLARIVLVFLATACLAMAAVPGAWALPVVIFALRFAGQGMCSHLAMVAMARWFAANRGRALSIALVGFALGEALLPVSFVALMPFVGWRSLWVAAAVMALVALPVLAFLLRQERTPQSHAAASQSLGMGGRHWPRRAVLRHWLFWMMVPALLGPAAFVTSFFFQQVHLAEVKGWEHVQLVALFPLATGAGLISMFGAGWAIDRFGTARLMPLYQVPIVVAFLIFWQAEGLGAAAVGLTFMAITIGANSTLPAAFWAEFYGTAHLGAVKAMGSAVMVLGTALGPGLTGALIDLGLPFPAQMPAIAAYFALASALVLAGTLRARRDLPVAA
ncbi:MFS family permease [Rhodovulum iodosum]|uniref:MFS family permease n=1 Tax=Rhodovulum iodosum TaxID=68291 RepID=A0ABV3XSA2_9RHOB|nr:MFS transporter [Rhodovulum robiginosum]RSK30311.1 MFS transporter [Rhodovulum robiginosum]